VAEGDLLNVNEEEIENAKAEFESAKQKIKEVR